MIRNAINEKIAFGIILSEDQEVFSKGVKVTVDKVYKEYENGEYDILVKGQELFHVISTKVEEETVVGNVEYVPISTVSDNSEFQSFQDAYLKILLKFGIDKDFDLHMNKKISYEFLQGIQLPLNIKKELITISDEIERLRFIKNIFNNILETDADYANGNIPKA
mgnify:CR=1 FL=1|tara:strand:+ start:632 stop:1126 length:495 start_codon:yes stop_codon:yes gene_type:complete